MHPSARPMSANISRIAAGGLQGKIVVVRRVSICYKKCVTCPILLLCSRDLFCGARKCFVTSTRSERNCLQGGTDKILLEGLNLPSEWMLQHPASE
jgi:hypothetical protein